MSNVTADVDLPQVFQGCSLNSERLEKVVVKLRTTPFITNNAEFSGLTHLFMWDNSDNTGTLSLLIWSAFLVCLFAFLSLIGEIIGF